MDLSGVDAELDSLGSAPENAFALARSFAGIDIPAGGLHEIDRELGLLEGGVPRAPAVDAAAAESTAPAIESAFPTAESSESAFPAAYEPTPDSSARESERAPSSASVPLESGPAPAFEFVSSLESGPAPALESSPAPSFGSGVPAARESGPAPSSGPGAGDELESWPPLHRASSASPEPDAEHSPPSAVHSMPPPALTQSQEIVLPDPIPREELSSESGELRLDGQKPASGSFSLDAPEPVESQPPVAEPQRARRLSSFVSDDIGDALEGSEPLSLGNARGSQSKAPPFTFDRDPDAEFDALLSEATDPGGMPTEEDGSEADALLEGLMDDDVEELHADLPTTEFDPEESAETAVSDATDELALLMLGDTDDSTEVLDRATLSAIEDSTTDDEANRDADSAQQRALDDLDSGELEMGELDILMEEDQPPTKAAPPPPPPAPGAEKRPSGFLGRFFGRGERE